jgi:hypothetical protein
MATVSKSQTVTSSDGSVFSIVTELDTDNGKQFTTINDGSGGFVMSGTPDKVISRLATFAKTPKYTELSNASITAVENQKTDLTAQYQQLVPPPKTEPVATAAETTPDKNNLTGSADGDNTYDKKAAGQANANSSDNQTTNNVPELVVTSDRPVAAANVSDKPGTRTFNPLGNFASYTYQISLYMITPDAYDAFVISGRKNINVLISQPSGGAYLIAQSGGINNKSSKRAPGFELDFYIDDLKLKHAVSGPASGTESNVIGMSFTVYEPYGFSFISRLNKASEALQANSKLPNYRDLSNELKQFFVLGLRFQGYDINGAPISNTNTTLKPDSATIQSNGITEKFYDIIIQTMKFTLDGKMATYKITAATLQPAAAYSTKRALINSDTTVVGETVFDVLKGDGNKAGTRSLISILNQQQRDIKSKTVYKLEFIGPSDDIKNALLISSSPDKSRAAPSPAKNTSESTDAESVRSSPNLKLISMHLGATQSIMQAISNIIKQSEYMSRAVNTLQKTKLDGDGNSTADQLKNNKPRRFRWFNLSSIVKCLGWNTELADWDYEITYVIQPYSTPAIVSPYINKTDDYYGPHKRYEYWYTGQNSEIISYEQIHSTTYYTVLNTPIKSETAQNGGEDTSQVPNRPNNQDRTGTIGDGLEAQNSVLANLFDPGAVVKAKVNIMGDPDFLMHDSPGSLNEVYRQFYESDGFTINPNGGQVFFEIYFKEGVDYNNKNGLMTINDQILLWNYPGAVAAHIKGISYRLLSVESNFSKGKFVQELIANINSLPNAIEDADANNREKSTGASTTGKDVRISSQQAGTIDSQNSNGTSTGSTGYTPDNEFAGVDEAIAQQANAALLANARGSVLINNQTSPTGGSNANGAPFAGAGTAAENTAGQQNNNGVIISKNVADEDATINTITSRQAAVFNQDDGREIPEDTRGNRSV